MSDEEDLGELSEEEFAMYLGFTWLLDRDEKAREQREWVAYFAPRFKGRHPQSSRTR